MEKILFIQKFFDNWREVGSVTPSSKFLVKKMLEPVDFARAKVLVELGAGSGCVTKEILKKMSPDARLFVFETDKDFCRGLEKLKDSRMVVYNESALNLPSHFLPESVDCIISGIPLATLSRQEKKNLLQYSFDVLIPKGGYVQFQYSTESYDDLKNMFSTISRGFTPWNIPPAFVFACSKN